MKDFKLYGRCIGCQRKRFFVRKRTIDIPNASKATSQDHVCTPCFKGTLRVLNLMK